MKIHWIFLVLNVLLLSENVVSNDQLMYVGEEGEEVRYFMMARKFQLG